MERFDDDHAELFEFGGEFLVHCPRCDACARVVASEPGRAARVACPACAYAAAWTGDAYAVGAPADFYFRLPVWLSVPCCGDTLWAYNAAHLEWLERYVAATVRARSRDGHGWSNRALASRLPRWIKLAKNRDAVRAGLQRLRERLARSAGEPR